MFKIGVFGILFDEQRRVLLCHRRDYDLWNLPGGGLEEGEAPWQGAIREVKEETGFDVEIERLSGIYFKPAENEVCFVFLCMIKGGQLTLNDEADQIEYFSVDQIPTNTSQKQVERIRDIIEDPGRMWMKIQTQPRFYNSFLFPSFGKRG